MFLQAFRQMEVWKQVFIYRINTGKRVNHSIKRGPMLQELGVGSLNYTLSDDNISKRAKMSHDVAKELRGIMQKGLAFEHPHWLADQLLAHNNLMPIC